MASRMPTAATTSSPTATRASVCPGVRRPSIRGPSSSGIRTPAASIARGVPTRTVCESTVAVAPRPGWAKKPSAGGISIPIRRAWATSRRAMGCSECCSTAAASRNAAAVVKRATVSTRSTLKPGQGESARLVEDHGLQPAEVFEHRAALHEDPPADEETGPGGNGGRRGEHQAQGQATTSTATLRDGSPVTQKVNPAAARTAGTK